MPSYDHSSLYKKMKTDAKKLRGPGDEDNYPDYPVDAEKRTSIQQTSSVPYNTPDEKLAKKGV